MPLECLKIATLIEVADRVINLTYLIQRRRVGRPDPRSEIEIHLLQGAAFRLKGEDARLFDRRLAEFVPIVAEGTANPTVVRKRRGPGSLKSGE